MDEELFFFQEVGADWLSVRKVALLADEMGLGKSAQAISAADRAGFDRVLVVCPAAARINWEREFQKFSKKNRAFQRIESRSQKIDPTKSVICSYDLAILSDEILNHKWDALFLDEAHFCKNLERKRSKRIFGRTGLCHNTKATWALSGTPAPNHIGELWIILYTFGATKLKYDEFLNRYCIMEWGPHGPKVLGNNKAMLPELKEVLAKIMLRRKKEDVMTELPEIFFSDMEVEPADVDPTYSMTLNHYAFPVDRRDQLMEKLAKEELFMREAIELADNQPIVAMKALEAMAGSVSTLRRYNGMQKIKPCAELVKAELDAKAYSKLVIFAVHVDVIEGLREILKDYGVVTLYGATPPARRQRNIDKFQKDKKTRIFIGNIQAAGTAITLTAAHNVIFVEQDWVPANNAQAAMRCHRIGQTKPVFVRFLGVSGSIDARIAQILRKKSKDLLEIFD